MRKFFAEKATKDLVFIAGALLLLLGIALHHSIKGSDTRRAPLTEAEDAGAVVRPAQAVQVSETDADKDPNKMNIESFRQLTQEALIKFPSTDLLRDRQRDTPYDYPELLEEAGIILGQIAQALHDNSELGPAATVFYEECFMRRDLPTQIRGLCLANHRQLRVGAGESKDWTDRESSVPSEVLRLAQFIPVAQ